MSRFLEDMKTELDKHHQEQSQKENRTKELINLSKKNKVTSIKDGNYEDYFVAIYCSTCCKQQMTLAKKLKELLLKMNDKDRVFADLEVFKLCWETNNEELYSFLKDCIFNKKHKDALLKKEEANDSVFILETGKSLKTIFSKFHKMAI